MDVSLIEMALSALSAGLRRPRQAALLGAGMLASVALGLLVFHLIHPMKPDLATIVAIVVAAMVAIVGAVFLVGAAIRGAIEAIAAIARRMRSAGR